MLAITALVLPASARADQADDLIRKGIELRREGRDLDALESFQKAHALAPTPRVLAQMGFAEQALGRWTDAYEHVDAALQVPADAWIAKNRSVLESSLTTIRKHVGELEILGEPAGAEIRVDGRPQGKLPLTRRIHATAGTASVEVRAAGFLTITRTVLITPNELTRETIVLQPVAPLVASPAEATRTPEVLSGGGDSGQAPEASSASLTNRRRLAWVGVAGAGLFVAGGVAALLVRESKAEWFVDASHGCDENAINRGGAGCNDAYQSGQTAIKLAVGTFVGAGLLAAGATILFLTSPPAGNGAPSSTVGLACAPTAGGHGVACVAQF
ncbi:MAG TPA: PEGA domain-containing protein [Polyangia bacterium]|nr:PEGA domain-containing protein [Polyangia bacterium]